METLIDLEKAQEICGGDFNLFRSLIAILVESYNDMHQDIERAFQAQGSIALEDAVHKLKGALRNLAAVKAVEFLQMVEDLAKTHKIQQAHDKWIEGQGLLTQTLEFLQKQEGKKDF